MTSNAHASDRDAGMDAVIDDLIDEFRAWSTNPDAILHLAGYVGRTVIYVAEPDPLRSPGLLIGSARRIDWADSEPIEGAFLVEMVELFEPGRTLPPHQRTPASLSANKNRIHWYLQGAPDELLPDLPQTLQEISAGTRPAGFVDRLPVPWPGPLPRPPRQPRPSVRTMPADLASIVAMHARLRFRHRRDT